MVVLLAIGGGAFLLWRNAHVPHPSIATLRAESGFSVWTVQVDSQVSHVLVHAARLRPRPTNYKYELWAWPRLRHVKPVSLGQLPWRGMATYTLAPAQRQALIRWRQVAVTVEARGSRMTGRRVILKAPLQSSQLFARFGS